MDVVIVLHFKTGGLTAWFLILTKEIKGLALFMFFSNEGQSFVFTADLQRTRRKAGSSPTNWESLPVPEPVCSLIAPSCC